MSLHAHGWVGSLNSMSLYMDNSTEYPHGSLPPKRLASKDRYIVPLGCICLHQLRFPLLRGKLGLCERLPNRRKPRKITSITNPEFSLLSIRSKLLDMACQGQRIFHEVDYAVA